MARKDRHVSGTPATQWLRAHGVAFTEHPYDYVAHGGENTGYYFTTPSGKWRCAILTRIKAGCQASRGWQSGLGPVAAGACPRGEKVPLAASSS